MAADQEKTVNFKNSIIKLLRNSTWQMLIWKKIRQPAILSLLSLIFRLSFLACFSAIQSSVLFLKFWKLIIYDPTVHIISERTLKFYTSFSSGLPAVLHVIESFYNWGSYNASMFSSVMILTTKSRFAYNDQKNNN